METPRPAEEIIKDLQSVASEDLTGAIAELTDTDRAALAQAVLPNMDEHEANVQELDELTDPELGTR